MRPRSRRCRPAIGSKPAARAATTTTPGSLPASGGATRTPSTAWRFAGSFSQSASVDDTSSYTTDGSVGASGQWVPNGSGSDTLITSSGNSFSGSGRRHGDLDLAVRRLGFHRHAKREESAIASRTTPPITPFLLPPGGGGGAGGEGIPGRPPAATAPRRAGKRPSPATRARASTSPTTATSPAAAAVSATAGRSKAPSRRPKATPRRGTSTPTIPCRSPPAPGGQGARCTGRPPAASGSTVDSGGSSFSYAGSGSYGGTSARQRHDEPKRRGQRVVQLHQEL